MDQQQFDGYAFRSQFQPPELNSRQHRPPATPPQRNDARDMNSEAKMPDMANSPSVASDRFSTVSGLASYFPAHPTHVHPAPAYVAPFGASQVVSEHQAARKQPSSDDEDAGLGKDDVQFSEPALALVNAFLDQLLYAFLSTARSTSLPALRLAVTEVLRHRLAREALASADDELRELLAGGEDDEEESTQNISGEDRRKWDLELVWKRTRLRVMVYTRLGELEDEDEEKYVKEQELFHGNEKRFSSTTGLVSWASAIFLTSVLEYVAEQTLQVAGQASYKRAKRHTQLSSVSGTPLLDRVEVEEYDVEKVALNSSLGRLWRTWRRSLRNIGTPSSPSPQIPMNRMDVDRSNLSSAMSNRRSSFGTAPEDSVAGDHEPSYIPAGMTRGMVDVPDMQYPEHVLAANIPLPLGETRRDIDEIEVPGLARAPESEDEGSMTPIAPEAVRRNSLTARFPFRNIGGSPTLVGLSSQTPQIPGLHRKRSNSVPALFRTRMLENAGTMPGTFPETPAVEKEPSDVLPEESKKAIAVNAILSDRAPQDVSILLDRVADNTAPNETEAQKELSEHHGLAGAAVAGMAAAASGAAAMLYRSKERPMTSDIVDTAPQSDGVGEKSGEQIGPSTVQLAPPEQKDVNDLDRRKSLLDIKSLIVPTSGSPDESREPSEVVNPRVSSAQALAGQAEGVPSSEEPKELHALGDEVRAKEDIAGYAAATTQALPEAQAERDIQGVVRGNPATLQQTPGAPVVPNGGAEEVVPTTVVLKKGFDTDQQYVPAQRLMSGREEQTKGPISFISQPSENLPPKSPIVKTTDNSANPISTFSPSSFRDFLQSRSLSSTSQPGATVEEARRPYTSPSVAQTRSPATGQTQNVPDWPSIPGPRLRDGEQKADSSRTPSQQARTPVLGKGALRPKSLPAPRGSKDDVQEHPVVQRMASLKRSEKKTEEKPKDGTLTSASIKRPEDFDTFVNGEKTVKYTLTPETVRDSGPSTTSLLSAKSGQAPEGNAPQTKRPSPPPPPQIDTRQGRNQDPRPATSSASPQNGDIREGRSEKRRSLSRPSQRNISAHRRSGLMAREPRVMTESTRDFSDFIRSTGPSREPEPSPIVKNRSTTSLNRLRSASVNGSLTSQSPSGERPKIATKTAIQSGNVPPVPPMPSKGRPSMRARDAVSGSRSNSDLINFIRDGPDQAGQHRISRSVAPFRSTMDSDQLKDLGERIGADRRLADSSSVRSTGASSQKSPSTRTSTHSQARLLNGSSASGSSIHPAYSGQPQLLAAPGADGPPPRRRYRNKDPYAIDTDEEDDDLITALPLNKRQEESLADFLKNNEPPADNAPRPIVNGGPAQARSIMNRARAASINSLKSANAEQAGRTQSLQSPSGLGYGHTQSLQSLQSNRPDPSSRQSQITNTVTAPTQPRRPTPRMEARSSGSKEAAHLKAFHQSATSDLADFLRTSGPDGPVSEPAPLIGNGGLRPRAKEGKEPKKEKRGFFNRKPKSTKKSTYLDMP